jgi:hypothetical protein
LERFLSGNFGWMSKPSTIMAGDPIDRIVYLWFVVENQACLFWPDIVLNQVGSPQSQIAVRIYRVFLGRFRWLSIYKIMKPGRTSDWLM